MLAYMNEEAYNRTITEGIMTYYSRSRKCLWLKGETSGNYQYVKKYFLIVIRTPFLQKFFPMDRPVIQKIIPAFIPAYLIKNIKLGSYGVLQSVYDVIMDRKKILKKAHIQIIYLKKELIKFLKNVEKRQQK